MRVSNSLLCCCSTTKHNASLHCWSPRDSSEIFPYSYIQCILIYIIEYFNIVLYRTYVFNICIFYLCLFYGIDKNMCIFLNENCKPTSGTLSKGAFCVRFGALAWQQVVRTRCFPWMWHCIALLSSIMLYFLSLVSLF